MTFQFYAFRRKFNKSSTRPQNSTRAAAFEVDLGEDVGALDVSLGEDVGVDVGRRAHLRVAEARGDAHDVHTGIEQHGGGGVAESVRVEVREAVAL